MKSFAAFLAVILAGCAGGPYYYPHYHRPTQPSPVERQRAEDQLRQELQWQRWQIERRQRIQQQNQPQS